MKILFYIEPLPELGRPAWKKPWLYFVRDFIAAYANKEEFVFHCMLGKALEADAKALLPNCEISVIDFIDLVPALANSSLDVASKWYQGAYQQSDIDLMASLFPAKLHDEKPNMCISLSPAPFLKKIFPSTKVFYRELGMLSRFPFPSTSYFDPFGMFSDSSLIKYADEIRAYEPTAEEIQFISKLKAGYQRCLLQDNPLEFLRERLSGFSKAVLLPLQFSNFYAYDCNAEIVDQYEFLERTLASLPKDYALLVSEHPQHKVLDEESLEYLIDRYDNLIWDQRFHQYTSLSQLLMPYVDAVITVSSSVGMQSLLWGKTVIVVGHSHLDLVADGFGLQSIISTVTTNSQNKNHILAWLLTRYYLPEHHMLGLGLIEQYIDNHNVLADFSDFKPIVDIDQLAKFYIDSWQLEFDEHWVNRLQVPACVEQCETKNLRETLAAIEQSWQETEQVLEEKEIMINKKNMELSSVESKAQELERVVDKLTDDLRDKKNETECFQQLATTSEQERQMILSSYSWRFTAPLRFCSELMMKIRNRLS